MVTLHAAGLAVLAAGLPPAMILAEATLCPASAGPLRAFTRRARSGLTKHPDVTNRTVDEAKTALSGFLRLFSAQVASARNTLQQQPARTAGHVDTMQMKEVIMMMADVLLSVAEVADELAVSLDTVRRLLLSGELPGYRLRGQWRVSRSDLGAFLQQRRNYPSTA